MIKKLILLAIAAVVVFALVKWIPRAIEEERYDYSEKLINKEDFAQDQAEDMVGQGSDGADNRFGGEYNKKARKNINKASRRSMDRLKEMQE